MASVLYTRKNLERQPKEVRKVKFNNRFLRSPQLLWNGASAQVPLDLIYGQIGSANTSSVPIQNVLPLGLGLTFGNSTSKGFIFPSRGTSTVPRYTMAAHFRPAASSTYQVLVANSPSGGNGFMMQINSSGTSINLVKPAIESVNSLSLTIGEDYFCIMSHDEVSDAYYILLRNMRTGVITSVSGTTSSAASAPDGSFVIGNITNSGVDRSFNGIIYSAYIGYDFIPLNTALDWINNSWAHFNSEPEIFHLLSVTAYELSLDPNTYTQTNSAISFYIDRLLSLSANSYSLTNNNISLLVDKLLALSPNTYNLTNSNITLLADKLISLTENSYVQTNSDPALLYARNFSLDSNSYTLTNGAVSLYLGKLLSVDPGSYTLTNNAISFYSDKVLSADPATFTLTNNNVSLYSGKLLNLDSNVYTLTNSDPALLYARNFSLDSNSYTLTLSAISFAFGKLFVIDPATFTFTNQDISYYYNKTLSLDSNTYVLTNSNISFSTSGGFVIDPATFTLTNNDISLLVDKLISLTPNTYTETTSGISFVRNYVLSLNSNAYNLLFSNMTFVGSYVYPPESSVKFGVIYGPDGDYKTGTFLGFSTVDISSGRNVIKTTLRTSIME